MAVRREPALEARRLHDDSCIYVMSGPMDQIVHVAWRSSEPLLEKVAGKEFWEARLDSSCLLWPSIRKW